MTKKRLQEYALTESDSSERVARWNALMLTRRRYEPSPEPRQREKTPKVCPHGTVGRCKLCIYERAERRRKRLLVQWRFSEGWWCATTWSAVNWMRNWRDDL